MIATAPRLTPQREREIAEIAERIALEHFPAGVIDPEQIAVRTGITFEYARFKEDIDGLLVHENGRFYIFCNERRVSRGSPRSRFTFAHELGHFFLDSHRNAVLDGRFVARFTRPEQGADVLLEKEADIFAANLLMPTGPFKREAGEGCDLNGIRSLATAYGTSLRGTAYRVVELDLLPAPCSLFIWNLLGSSAGRRLSPATMDMELCYPYAITRPPVKSITARAFGRRPEGVQCDVIASTEWFHWREPERNTGCMLQEEVMSLGLSGWMTLVQPLPVFRPG